MASNDRFDDTGSPYGSLLKTAITMAPIGIGAYVGIQNIRANEPLGLGLGGSNLIKNSSQAAGRQLRTAIDTKQANRNAAQAKVLEDLLEENVFQKFWQTTAQQNELLQSILTTLDDPSTGLPADQSRLWKDQIYDILRKSEELRGGSDTKEAISKVVNALTDQNNPRAARAFTSYLGQFKGLGSQITAPSEIPMAGINETAFTGQLSGIASARAKRVRDLLPGNMEIVQVKHGGLTGIYGKIHRTGQGGVQRWVANVPLDLSGSYRNGVPIMFMGENFQTPYQASMQYGSARGMFNAAEQGSGLAAMKRSGAVMGPEDAQVHIVQQAIQNTKGRFINSRDINQLQRDVLTVDWRTAHLRGKAPKNSLTGRYADHLGSVAALSQANIHIMDLGNMSAIQQEQFPHIFVGKDGFDPGVSPAKQFYRTVLGRVASNVGLAGQGALAHMRTGGLDIGGMAREATPLVSRIEQIVGRTGMFLDRNRDLGQSFQTRAFSPGMNGRNIGWSEALTGGTNRAVLMDVRGTDKNGKSRLGLSGEGQAYSTRGGTVVQEFTKPILEPTQMRMGSSKLLDRLLEKAGDGGEVTLTRKQLEKYGGYLGEGANGPQYLRLDPHMQSITIGVERLSNVNGKVQIHAAGTTTKKVGEGTKLFGTMFKGTLKIQTKEQQLRAAAELGVTPAMLSNMKINPQDLLIVDADMLKKAPSFLSRQMISGMGLAANVGGDPFEVVEEMIKKGGVANTTMGTNPMAKVTAAVMELLSKSKAGAEEIGSVLTAVAHVGEKFEDRGMTVKRTDFDTALTQFFGSKAAAIQKQIEFGGAFAADTHTSGPQPGDWGRSRGSTEPRFMKMLQQRLRSTPGMTEADVSNFMAKLLERKSGIGGQMAIMTEFDRMQASLHGVRGFAEEFRGSVREMNMADVSDLRLDGDRGAVSRLMRESTGVLVDLSSDGSAAGDAIAASARRKFSQGTLFLPGGDVLDQMKGSVIKTGGASQEIQPKYMRMVEQLFSDLRELKSSPEAALEADSVFEKFKRDAIQLSEDTRDSLVRGKIHGSGFMTASTYDFGDDFYLEGAQKRYAEGAFRKSKGNAVFLDHKAFLSNLNDFMGTQRGKGKTRDVADQLKSFFMTPEMGGARAKGIAAMASRHPILTASHTAPIQQFRHAKEVGLGAKDEVWQAFMATKQGKLAAQNFAGATGMTPAGFNDIAAYQKKNLSGPGKRSAGRAIDSFFNQMAKAVPQFGNFEGGGLAYFPRSNVDITWNGGAGKTSAQMSLLAGMIGDADGDSVQVINMDREMRSRFMTASKEANLSSAAIIGDNRARATFQILSEEAKFSLQQDTGMTGDAINRLRQDVLKERGMKAVGQFDVRLNMLRSAIVGFGGHETEQARNALAMLGVVEEFGTIKGKKTAQYQAHADRIGATVEEAFRTGNLDEFKHLMKTEVFKGSDFFGPGITVAGAEASGQNMGFASRGIQGMRLSGDDTFEFMARMVAASRERYDLWSMESVGRSVSELTGTNGGAVFEKILLGGETLTSGLIHGNTDDFLETARGAIGVGMEQVKHATSKMDRHFLGPIAAGVGASVLIGAMIGDQGYSPSPLSMPGEATSPAVSQAISSGALFSDNVRQPSPEDFNPGVHQNIYNTPINQGQAVLQRNNAYQVRGEMSGTPMMSSVNSMLQGMTGGRGSGSITINDRRRPLTQNYVDRLIEG